MFCTATIVNVASMSARKGRRLVLAKPRTVVHTLSRPSQLFPKGKQLIPPSSFSLHFIKDNLSLEIPCIDFGFYIRFVFDKIVFDIHNEQYTTRRLLAERFFRGNSCEASCKHALFAVYEFQVIQFWGDTKPASSGLYLTHVKRREQIEENAKIACCRPIGNFDRSLSVFVMQHCRAYGISSGRPHL
jgi:hypothetical protein